jgi:hypothetical protein
MGEQFVGDDFALGTQMGHGIGKIGRVPIDDGRDDEIEARGAELLRFMGAIGNPALLEGADSLG